MTTVKFGIEKEDANKMEDEDGYEDDDDDFEDIFGCCLY